MKTMKVFSGKANEALTQSICDYLEIPLGEIKISSFKDGEHYCQIKENVRGVDVFVVQPTSPPVSDNLMQLLILVDAFKRASASRITAVIPYFGYARQDRKDRPRVPISARLVSNLITASGVDRVVALDLHAAQIQGFFDIPVDHLYATPVLLKYLTDLKLKDIVVVSPDAGGADRARFLAKRLDSGFALVDKRRPTSNVAEVVNVIGDVEGKNAIIIDDMVDTAGTLTKTANKIKEMGAVSVIAAAAHPVFSGAAIENIEKSVLDKVIITNTIPLTDQAVACPKIVQLSIAELLGEAMKRIHEETSVSSLFV